MGSSKLTIKNLSVEVETLERDPRIDPRPGDVVRKGNRERIVVEWRPREQKVVWTWSGLGRVCFITTWRDWCRKAEVVQKGGE